MDFYLGTQDSGTKLGTADVINNTAELTITLSEEKGFKIGENTITADFGGSIAVIGPDDVAPILHPAISCIFSDQSDTPPVFVYKNDMRRTAADRFQTEVSGSGK